MEFFPYEPFDQNEAQIKVWNWVKEAFKNEDGVAYYRYPLFTNTGRLNREPDVLILHRDLGLWVIECKSYSIDNIFAIQGHQWLMSDWYQEAETPVAQAEDQMFALKNKLEQRRETRGKINCNFRVALPNIRKREWENTIFCQLPSTEGVVLLYEDLTPTAFKKHLTDNAQRCRLSQQDWDLVKGVLGGTLSSREPRNIATGTPVDNPIRVISYIESQLKILDETQQKISFEVPEGPQRLRGLAGTGKTVLLAKRAAKLHIKYPEKTIGFIFFTRSLYVQITDLITLYHKEMHPEHLEPNWEKLKILHSWGGKEENGFYYDLANYLGVKRKTVDHIKHELGNCSPADGFEYCCLCLLRDLIIRAQDIIKKQNDPKMIESAEHIISLTDKNILENKAVF